MWDFSAWVSQVFDNKIFKEYLIFEILLQKGGNTNEKQSLANNSVIYHKYLWYIVENMIINVNVKISIIKVKPTPFSGYKKYYEYVSSSCFIYF